MDYFLRHHPGRARTLVLSMDTSWCHADRYFARDRIAHPFPFWLYDGDRLTYASHVITFEAIGLSFRKIMIALGLRPPRARADGYDNFELGRMWRIDEAWQRLGMDARIVQWMSVDDPARMDSFVAFDALDAFIGGLPPETKVALVFTPYYAGGLPEPGSLTAQRLDACKARAARLAQSRGAAYLDFMQDNAATRDPANYWDPTHYRSHIAREVEDRIAGALSQR